MNCPFPGWCVEILKMMADSLHLSIDNVLVNNSIGSLDWGTVHENDTWSGVLGFLANGTADTACLLYQRTDVRDLFFELSYPVTNIQPIYVVRRQESSVASVLWNAFKPYSYVTWIAIIGSFLLQLLFMVFISYVEVKAERRTRFRPYEMAWDVLQLQLDEKSENMVFHTFAGNMVLFMFALLQSAFFTYLYEGLLLSALLHQVDTDPFKNADGVVKLIAAGKYHLVTNYRSNWYFDELDHSNASHFFKLRTATLNNPVVVADSVEDALDLVEEGNHIFPIQEDSLAMQMSKERCNLVYVSEGLPQRSAHLVFANNSVFIEQFNLAIIMQSSFIQRTFRKYFLEGFKIAAIPKCPPTEFQEGTKPLDVNSVVGIFTLAGVGMLSAIAAFAAEIYYFWHTSVILRRWRARTALGSVQNLLEVAKFHFTSQSEDRFDIIRLADFLDRTRNDQ